MIQQKSDVQLSNEAIVTRHAKELAKLHLADSLLAAIHQLGSKLYELAPGHTEQGMSATGRKSGFDLAGELLNSLVDNYPLDYQRIVNEANEDGDEINDDAVIDSVHQYVKEITAGWRA